MSNWFAQLVSVPGLAGLEAELNWFRQLVSPLMVFPVKCEGVGGKVGNLD